MKAKSWKRSRLIGKLPVYLFIILVLIGILFPIFWMVSTAIKPEAEYLASPPIYIPQNPTFSAFSEVYKNLLFPALSNSLIICSLSTLLAVIIGSLAAYGFVRFDFPGRKNIIFWIFSTRMFPPVITAIPLFLLFKRAHLIDTHLGLILIYTMFNLPFVVILMHSFFQALPKELEESAWIEGCSYLGSFFRISLPLTFPGVIASIMFSFIFAWNEFFFALVFTRTRAGTLPLAIAGLHATWGVAWGQIAALTIIITLPVIMLCFLLQKQLIRGMTFGALKG